ncbi:Phospholipid/glycerol acyltransferase OS=Tsukamurella paurometabola (strain ATCC 8368 / DSM/ CCUG 35730 / CIP 100753 / JCM 10117 / KCTC 9821 / NBRC 16120/ NCIMB 702349 / NCTC 13040) OX=521096 GN=Tpau_1082 PE=4 SV=1 [Tsukamurella paurometabola]|uniref:Phospholipid/glycerol acyltransferase n=1 Tax=Tsukamurella paurometabola (strain ATCC 8368 / DSM 20162 / CCUG 35730 / CIP 100753 / JCM 10117 / KCTC 9821 / NBRC 16120 / NCIMB 702349 / NCTC 13040) TaxID=521096 RepID=D5UVC4_TSUPD|nr:lysophospholipid acyltransferase family protein [Tsukamurella paurometabola]ADG77714.1 phospholipid/glycerol acyltransferase [Tsukamurella paurometabola DSM 20162]SUP28425.1 1-acyl-sn-glycerol-3-phosphate acyltransferase [Tsukamurella paurometabola]
MSISSLRAAFRYRVARHLVIGPGLLAWGRPRITGQDYIPRKGAVILAANHLAVSDSFYVVLAARRPVMFLAKADYFTQPGLMGKAKKTFFAGMGQIPVDRSGGAASSPALEAATKIVEHGGAWGIHPEGTRSPDGRLYKGKTGAVRVALATGTPIIPIALCNTENRTLKNFWRRDPVTVDVLPPLDLSDASPDDEASVRRATDQLMDILGKHTGQEQVAEYAKPGGK